MRSYWGGGQPLSLMAKLARDFCTGRHESEKEKEKKVEEKKEGVKRMRNGTIF